MKSVFPTDDIESNKFNDSLVQRSIGSAHTVPLHFRSRFPTLPTAVQSVVAVSPPLVIGHTVSAVQNGSPAEERFQLMCMLSA